MPVGDGAADVLTHAGDEHRRRERRKLTKLRVGGSTSITSRVVVILATFCVSTIGEEPVTVTVSSSAPTLRSALTLAVNDAVRVMSSRRTVEKPASEKLTE